jgi:hypothetical protein
VQRERLLEAAPILTGVSKPNQVWVQELQDGAVARTETAAAAIEAEDPEHAAGRDTEPQDERIFETIRLQHQVVQICSVELAPAKAVRNLDGAEPSSPKVPR